MSPSRRGLPGCRCSSVTEVGGRGSGEAGRAPPADDPEAWREAVIQFATNPKLRGRWANAPSTVREERDMVAEIEAIYGEAIEFATRGPP